MTTSRADYAKVLDRLVVLLKRRPLTASEVAARLECSMPTAYKRIYALGEHLQARGQGESVFSVVARSERTTGPVPTAYGVR